MNSKTKPQKRVKSPKFLIGILIPLGILSVVIYFQLNQEPLIRAATADSIRLGEKLFAVNCQSCHGIKAIGENPEIPMGGEKITGGYFAPALNGTGHGWHHPDDMLVKTIRDGSFAKDSQMKGFKDIMSHEEIVSVLHYFQSFWPKAIMDRRDLRAN